MADSIMSNVANGDGARWEYKVIRTGVGTVTFQKYGSDSFDFETTLNDWGTNGWEAFHVQAFADGEALLLFLKRPTR